MNAIASGVALSAARMRSPSFSRFSSSTTTINWPRLTADMAARTDSGPKHQPDEVVGEREGLGGETGVSGRMPLNEFEGRFGAATERIGRRVRGRERER